MRVTTLQWWAVLLPTIAIMAVDYARHEIMTGWMHPWWEEGALLAGVLVVTLGTSQLLSLRVVRSQRREREADTLRQASVEFNSSLELKSILPSVLRRGREVLDADCLGLALEESPRREMIMQARDLPGPRWTLAPPEADLLWAAMATGENREAEHLVPVTAQGSCPCSRYCMAIPLRMGSRVLGAICMGYRKRQPLSPRDSALAAQLVDIASIAIANALLHDRARSIAALEERDRIAREMHDSLAQVLGYLSMKAAAARELLAQGESRMVEAHLSEMHQVADEAYLDVREAILGLRESARASGGLVATLQEYISKFSLHSGIAAHLWVEEHQSFDLLPQCQIQLVRVIQEALTNVRKHAGATSVQVRLEKKDGAIQVSIEDNGHGFARDSAPPPLGGYGIVSMRERLATIGGSLSIASARGRGTTVVITVAPSEGEKATSLED